MDNYMNPLEEESLTDTLDNDTNFDNAIAPTELEQEPVAEPVVSEPVQETPVTMEEYYGNIDKDLGLVDNNGVPTSKYMSWQSTSPVAEQFGYTKSRPDPWYKAGAHQYLQSYHTAKRDIAKSFAGVSETAKKYAEREDAILESNRQWELADEQNIPGWIAAQVGMAAGTSLPTVATSAVIGALTANPVIAATGGFAAVAAQQWAAMGEEIDRDTKGQLDPFTKLGAQIATTVPAAAIEVLLGPERMLASGLAKLGGKTLSKAGLYTFAQNPENRRRLFTLGKMMFEGKMNTAALKGVGEGGEEVLQLGNYDTVLNAISGREFSPLAEYGKNFVGGFIGGTALGVPAMWLNSVEREAANKKAEELFTKPVTEQTTEQIYTSHDAFVNRDAMIKTQQSWDAFRSIVPEWGQEAVNRMERFAYNVSSETKGQIKPEALIEEFKTIFLGAPDAANKLQNILSKEALQFQTEEETLQALRTAYPELDRMQKNAADILYYNQIKKINDEAERTIESKMPGSRIDPTQRVSSYTKESAQEYKQFLSTVFRDKVIDGLLYKNNQIVTIPFADIRKMAQQNVFNSATMKALYAARNVDNVEIEDYVAGKFKANFRFNPDFSITISKSATPEQIAKLEQADAEQEARKQRSLSDKVGKRLSESNVEIDIARELLRKERLAKKSVMLDEFDSRWKEFINGTDMPTARAAVAEQLMDRLNELQKSKQMNADVADAVDRLNKAVQSTKKLLGPRVFRMPEGKIEEELVYDEWQKAVDNVIATVDKQQNRLLPEADPYSAKIAQEAMYNLRAMLDAPDPAQELIDTIDKNSKFRTADDRTKWRKDQFNTLAMRWNVSFNTVAKQLGVKDTGLTDVQKANAILLKVHEKVIDRTYINELQNAINELNLGQQGGGIQREVFNSQIDKEVLGTYLPSYKLAVFYANADADTIVHEWFHHLTRNNLLPERVQTVIKNQFYPNGWSYKAEEDATEAFTNWLMGKEIKNASPELFNAFEFIKKTMASAYEKADQPETKADVITEEKPQVVEQKVETVQPEKQPEVLNQKKAEKSDEQQSVFNPETKAVFDELFEPIDELTLESIYGQVLEQSMENSDVVNSTWMSDDEIADREQAFAEGKTLKQVGKAKKASAKQRLFALLHKQYGSHEAVMDKLGYPKGTELKDIKVSDLRRALRKDTGYTLEFMARNGMPDSTWEELRARSPEAYQNLINTLEDRTTSSSASPIDDADTMEKVINELVKEQVSSVSYANREYTNRENMALTMLKNAGNRTFQRFVASIHGLRDMTKFIGKKMHEETWGRLRTPYAKIATAATAIENEYIKKAQEGQFVDNIAENITLPSGVILKVGEMIDLYAKAEGKNLTMADVFDQKGSLNPKYSDVAAYMSSNIGEDMLRNINESVDYINSRPELKSKVENELDYLTAISNAWFDVASSVHKELTGETLNRLNKRWYMTLAREGGKVHEANVASVFDSITDKRYTTEGIRSPKEFETRFGGLGRKVSLEYRENALHHIIAMINYAFKAKPVSEIYSIINNPALQSAMFKRFGDDSSIRSNLLTLVKAEMNPTGNWKVQEGPLDRISNYITSNAYPSLVSWNLGMGAAQFTSWPMAFSELGLTPNTLTQMVKNTFSGMYRMFSPSRFKEAVKEGSAKAALEGWDTWEQVKKYGPVLARRVANPDAENIRKRYREGVIGTAFPTYGKLIGIGDLPLQFGDMIVNLATWKTQFDAQRELLAQENPTWTEEEINKKAGQIAVETVMSSQSATVPGEKSLWQRGGGLEKSTISFTGQSFQVLRTMVNDIVVPILEGIKQSNSLAQAAGNVGKIILNKKIAQKHFVGFVLPAIAMGIVARRRMPKDKEEMAVDILCYALSTLPIIGPVIWGSVALGWRGNRGATFFDDMSNTIVDAANDLTKGETVDPAKKIARVAAMVVGSPIAFNRFIETIITRSSNNDPLFNLEGVREMVGFKPRD